MKITMTLESLGFDPSDNSKDPMNRYQVTLTDDDTGNTVQFPFFTGSGWDNDPTIGDILDSLRADLSTDIDDAEDMGLTLRQWQALEEHQAKLEDFLSEFTATVVDGDWSDITGTAVEL